MAPNQPNDDDFEDGDFELVEKPMYVTPICEKYPDVMSKYKQVTNSVSKEPFCVDIGNDQKVFYCLSTIIDPSRVSDIVGKVHNCRACMTRMSKCGGCFGPQGYLVDFGGVEHAGPLYCQLEQHRLSSPSLNMKGTFIISEANLNLHPRTQGVNKETGESYTHIGLNYSSVSPFITSPGVANKITNQLLTKLWNGTMDGRLNEIVTMLQRKDPTTGKTDLEAINNIVNDNLAVLRKEFWEYRIDYCKRVQKFARQFQNGDSWERMSEVDQMHVRVFALLYGGNYSPAGENLAFKAASHVVDISKDSISLEAVPAFMNERSDPNSYMVRQVAMRNNEHNVASPFTVSLSWSTRSDLDGHLKILNTGEHIFYSNKTSRGLGETYLNFDANAGTPTTEPVETFTLSSKTPGRYEFYVNNYCTRGERRVKFTVVENINGQITTHEGEWNGNCRNDNTTSHFNTMIKVCAIDITQEMINKVNEDMALTNKEANRIGGTMARFTEKFGDIKTNIVDLAEVNDAVRLVMNGSTKTSGGTAAIAAGGSGAKLAALSALVQEQKIKTPKRETLGSRGVDNFDTMEGIITAIKSSPSSVHLGVRGRDYCPSTMTSHSCGAQLSNNLIVNSYIEEGKPPVQPNIAPRVENCRFEREWSSGFAGGQALPVTSILPVKHQSGLYEGYFLSLGGTCLPDPSSCGGRICVGAGMYPSDLTVENHVFRDIWQMMHSAVQPTVKEGSMIPALGVFVHHGKEYKMTINGRERTVRV